ARLDREDLPLLDPRGVAEERVLGLRLHHRAADVVRLEAERVTEAVRIEHAADALRVDLFDGAAREARVLQDRADLTVRLVVELLVRRAGGDPRAEALLHGLHRGEELRERR